MIPGWLDRLERSGNRLADLVTLSLAGTPAVLFLSRWITAGWGPGQANRLVPHPGSFPFCDNQEKFQ